ncbi:hypothetical protein RZN05_11865 [Sphingomonas sp. HF-S4]|uniref:Major capsid protein n=1 Tax=Sphingomonas agrestis TaxID=3080540 RepID=A0ABU3Y8I2_9SPHN|nr:hypothetical protein [Sphingomonas sp. HF-S4]MDV3457684.1 hypothetical protein [Sphingomonas sp. HF-S4]
MLKSEQQLSALADSLAADGVPTDLVNWLIKLKLLIGVPFNYLVPDNSFLPAETIRFFTLDANWINALTDGALSIGRHYNGADAKPVTLYSEQAHMLRAHNDPSMRLGNRRRAQLGLADDPPNTALASAVRSGFMLNSAAVSGWKNMDVAGYAAGSSPFDYENNPQTPASAVTPLKVLRLVRLSPTVLFGIFEGELFELVLHQPPEAIHFGFETINPSGTPNGVTKNLRVPTTSWDDPDTSYDADTHQGVSIDNVFVNPDDRVLDMMAMSKGLAAALAAITTNGANGAPGYYSATPADANFKDHLVSSDFGLEMVHGVGLVSFINE